MLQATDHANTLLVDCDIDFTLPQNFVQEWINQTTKQHWTGQMKYGETNKPGTGFSQVLMETDTCVLPDAESESRPYLCMKISGVLLHVQDKKLHLTVMDVKVTDTTIKNKIQPISDACRGSEGNDLGTRPVVSADFSFQSLLSSKQSASKELFMLKTQNTDCGITSKLPEIPDKMLSTGGAKLLTSEPLQNLTEACPGGRKTAGCRQSQSQSSQHSYRLRGKKLSFSRFGACDIDLEEIDDEDPRSCSKASPVKKLFQRKRRTRRGSDSIRKDKTVDQKQGQHLLEKEHTSSFYIKTDNETQNGQDLVEFATSEIPSSASSLTSPSSSKSRRKRSQGALTQNKSILNSDEPSKKKRLKITVGGLPAFSRRVANKTRKASCKYCQQKFCDFTGVVVHAKRFHGSEEDVVEYVRELGALAVTSCALCHQEFHNRFQLQLHEDKVHLKAGDMRCDRCGKSFANIILLKQHVRSVHLVQGQNHACSLCSARFKWAATLKTHIAEVHQGIKDLACEVCGKKFHRRSQLNRHSIIHGPDQAKLACELCERKFRYPSNLQRHAAIVHGPRKEAWHCAYCGKGFPRKESWSNHVEKVHFSLFPHQCRLCKMGFTRQTLLEKHMASKHGDSGFQAASARRDRFKYNVGDREKLTCGLCEDQFCYKARLVRHVFHAHRDTFPFRCDVCQQVFVEKSFLVFHRKRAHQIQPGPEEADVDVGEDTPAQERVGGFQNKRSVGSQDLKNKCTGEDDSETGALLSLNEPPARAVGIEGDDSHVQYVIQIPESLCTVPADSISQYMIGQLLTTEPSVQEDHENADAPPPTHELAFHVGNLQESIALPVPKECDKSVVSNAETHVEDQQHLSGLQPLPSAIASVVAETGSCSKSDCGAQQSAVLMESEGEVLFVDPGLPSDSAMSHETNMWS